MGKRTYVVGTCNNSAPALYRKYNCYDHLFHYEPSQPQADQSRMRMVLALEAFNMLATQQLDLEPRQLVSSDELLGYQHMIKPEKVLQQMLTTSPLAQDVRVELGADDKQIYLCRNYLIEMNENIARMDQITVFQTCCNYLRRIPCGIGHLRGLKMLILSRNRLIELPEELGFCKELREVDVSYNQLSRLPRSIVALKKLNSLQLTGNCFDSLPPFLGKLNSLKYLGVARNPIPTVPLEIFKLPFLLSISFDHVPGHRPPQRRFDEVGLLSLTEIVSRQIVRGNMPVHRHMPVSQRDHLLNVQECSFCGGPYFDYRIEVVDVHNFESVPYPISYSMCSRHYGSHEQRLPTLFERSIPTVPVGLQQDNMPSVTELFEPFAFNEAQVKKMREGAEGRAPLMPLISLAALNSCSSRRFRIEMLLDEPVEELNAFDKKM